MAFYKKTDSEILTAPNFVTGPSYELIAENYATYTYPVDGWYWFDSFDLALQFFAQSVDVISMRQCRLSLLQADLLDTIDSAMQSASEAAKIEWEYANEVRRDSPVLLALTASLNMTSEQVDALFDVARGL